jgi:hypothetical protein
VSNMNAVTMLTVQKNSELQVKNVSPVHANV